jgi:intracellular septation protein A
MDTVSQSPESAQKKKENSLLNIICNILIPIVVLSKFAKPDYLGDKWGLVVALAFPTIYFLYDFLSRKKINVISIIGFCGILIMGAIGLLELPREYVAYERAGLPAAIAIAVLVSAWMKKPLLKKMLYNKELMDTERIDALLQEKGKMYDFDKMMNVSSYLLAASFVLSAVLNYFLTQHIMADMSMTYPVALSSVIKWSIPIIAVPCCIVMGGVMWYMFKVLERITGLKMEEMFIDDKNK